MYPTLVMPGVQGVAPQARMAMYKAFWGPNTDASESDIIAAIDQAIADGVDILSLSIGNQHNDGFPLPLYDDGIAKCTYSAQEKGIFISASAGNEGISIPMAVNNGAPWMLTVAASTIDHEFSGVLTLGNGVSLMGSSLYPGNSTPPQIVLANDCTNNEELKKLGNKIAVCLDEYDTLGKQFYNIKQSSVAGAIFITNNLLVLGGVASSFSAVFLNNQNGKVVLDYIKSNNKAEAMLKFEETTIGIKPAPRVAIYSSRGPSRISPFVLKPDLIAPGSLILASWSPNDPVAFLKTGPNSVGKPLFSNFNIVSGMSMSAPQAAGVAALLKAAHPEWSPAAIRFAMMTTSDVLDNTFNPIQEVTVEEIKLATPLAMGAGHVNPNKAMDPGLIYDIKPEEYINYLCALNFTKEEIQSITRPSSFSCSNSSLDINYPSFIAFFSDTSNAEYGKEFRRSVTYVGDGLSSFEANWTQLNGFQISVVPNKLVFREKNEIQRYKVRIESAGKLE